MCASSRPARPTAKPTARGSFSALTSALADVPSDRVAGVVMITDGRVHDVPPDASGLGFAAPVHALITGTKDERDRRVALIAAPRFGIVGQPQTVTYRVEDQGGNEPTAQVTVRRDGDVVEQKIVPVGTPQNVAIPIAHGGPNIVEIEAAPLAAGELTQVNNRAVVTIDGVRDKLRVLLVSGEPHAGERTWRNLLEVRPVGRSRAFHHSAAAGKTGRHADQRIVADRLPDPRTVPAEDR